MPAIGAMFGVATFTLTLQPFIQKFSQWLMDKGSSILYIKDEIDNLEGVFSLIESVLKDVEDKQVESDSIRVWLRKLEDIGYEARDVLDEFYTVTASALVEEKNATILVSPRVPFFSFGSSSTTVDEVSRRRIKIVNEMKSVNERLDQMIKQKEIRKLLESVGGGGAASSKPDSRPESIVFFDNQKKNYLVGRKKEKKDIIEKLLDTNNNRVHVVPIWGMGGIGKTTLARAIFNDDEVKKIYPSQNKIWLSVGDKKFSGKDIMSKIVGDYDANVSVSELANKLVEKLKGAKFLSFLRSKKKFLIVLDDVWDIEMTEWKLLWNALTNVGSGGCIIITTRDKEVFIETSTPVEKGIKPLSFSDCWLIFESCAFVDGNSDGSSPYLKEVAQKIVKKLKGLPLAAEVVGCSLLNEQDVEEWRKFLEVGDYDYKGIINHALRWSYKRLPSYLKQCFAYCSLFPKDHEFDEKVLIEMWMAHDFIQKERGGKNQRPEDIGGRYFKKLVNASLFQFVDGKYMMHDMIHDLALLVSNEEFTTVNGSQQNISARHVSIASKYYNRQNYLKNLQLCSSKRILTIYTTDYHNIHSYKEEVDNRFSHKDIFPDILQQLKSIRVLVLVSYAIKDIPDCISILIHLRYLDLDRTNVTSLPDSICKLYNLQTLAIRLHAVLPKNIVNMANLRHLRANLTIDNGFGKLTSLQELSSISISKDTNIRELRDMLKRLHGKLVIKCLENVTNLQDAGQIFPLREESEDQTIFFTGEVLNVLSCPSNLTDLFIDWQNGINNVPNVLVSAGWMEWGVDVMKSLSKLTIVRYDGLTLLKVDPLVSLKYLEIKFCYDLTTISFGATVEDLRVTSCVQLNRMESGSTSSLKKLYLDVCKELRSLGNVDLQILKDLTVLKCPELMIEETSTSSSSPSTSLSNLVTDNLVLFRKVLEYNNHLSLESTSISHFGFEHFSESVLNNWNKLNFLRFLQISRCGNLKSLSPEFQNLPSLEKLVITSCPQLQLLPTDGLPLSLKWLKVYSCSNLREQCRVDSEHWHKFKHVPDIHVGS